MKKTEPGKAPLAQLETLMKSGRLSGDALNSGTRLLSRINSSVRVAILGLPGSGKSELLNFLAGQRVIPKNSTLPTLELVFGQTGCTNVTGQDGVTNGFDGLELEQITRETAAFVRVETDLPSLKKISLLEVVADGHSDDQVAATKWATQRADIVLWCSQGFTATEQKLWSLVPDTLKDRSFFILNKADILSAEGNLHDRISVLQNIVADEFHSLIPIATLQAISATGAAGRPDEVMLNASGGNALTKAISRQIEIGRRADIDSVLLFLNRYDPTTPQQSKASPKPSVEIPNLAKSQNAVAENVTPLPIRENHTVKAKGLNGAALDYLQGRVVTMAGAATLPEPGEILEQCSETASHLAEMYSDAELGSSDLQNDFLDAAEVLFLMQLEDGVGPAADAVTLLLQLKRSLEDQIAA